MPTKSKSNSKHKSGPIGEATKMLRGVTKLITKPVTKAGAKADREFGKLIGHNPRVEFRTGDRVKDKKAAEQYKRLVEYDGRKARIEKSWGDGWQVVVNRKGNPKWDSWPIVKRERGRASAEYISEQLRQGGVESAVVDSPGGYGYNASVIVRVPVDDVAAAKKIIRHITRPKKWNPESEAAEMYEKFHGAPSEEVAEYVEEERYHGHLAELGQLIEIKVYTVTGLDATFSFDYQGKPDKCVILASNEDGSSLYAIGGDQSLPLKDIKMDKEEYLKDSMIIGDAYFISYFTQKDFDKFQDTVYEHKLGEETGELPVLRYDRLNERIYLDGGAYCIKKPLLETSPGIEN